MKNYQCVDGMNSTDRTKLYTNPVNIETNKVLHTKYKELAEK